MIFRTPLLIKATPLHWSHRLQIIHKKFAALNIWANHYKVVTYFWRLYVQKPYHVHKMNTCTLYGFVSIQDWMTTNHIVIIITQFLAHDYYTRPVHPSGLQLSVKYHSSSDKCSWLLQQLT